MDEILKRENRERLYRFLIDDFGLIKISERDDPDAFGNFCITLLAKDFTLSYVNDRSFLTITISSQIEPEKDFDLSFVKDFIYNPHEINTPEIGVDNALRIQRLNDFLREDFSKIVSLFNSKNYPNTRDEISRLLKQQFIRKMQ